MQAYYYRDNKSEQNQMRQINERSKGLHTCEVWVFSVLAFDMYRIKNLKVKQLMVLLRHPFRSEIFKGIPKKVELVEAVTGFFKYCQDLLPKQRGGMSVVKNEAGREDGKEMG